MPVTEWLQDRYGIIWGGVYAMFSDAVVGTALQTGLPAGRIVNHVRADHVVRAASHVGLRKLRWPR